MSNSKNDYLSAFGDRINQLIIHLEAYRLKGSYGGELNLAEIISLIKGSRFEIEKLQARVDELEQCATLAEEEEDVVEG